MPTTNPILAALRAGRPAIGTMIVQERSPGVIQLFAEFGLEYFFIDMEHGPYNLETASDLIQVGRLAGIVPLVRIGEVQYTLYSRLLDAGAQGIMTPRVESIEQVERVLRYTRYPPLGERGFSRLAAHVNFADVDVAAYVRQANENILNIIQIESGPAVEQVEALIAVPGVSGVVVGLDDLSLSLGFPGDTRHPAVEAALERVVAACQAAHMPWGLHIPDVERLERWMRRGMLLCTFSCDVWMLQGALRAALPRLRAASPAHS